MKNNKNLDNCKHEWEYIIEPMKDSNLFIEKCKKCSETIGTLELFKD